MKKLIACILAMLLIISAVVSVSAANVDTSNTGKTVVNYGNWILEKINNDTQWELDEYVGDETEIITPRIIDNLLVVSFGDYCFVNNSNVKSVVTSSPLWTIGNYAFGSCTALEYFEFNYALNSIGVGAFSGTSSLKKTNINNSVVTEIKAYTFADSGLARVELPSTCSKIGEYAFTRCSSLLWAKIPDSVTEIADTAFEGCNNLVIVCSADSYAAQYAAQHNIECVNSDNFIIGDADGKNGVTIRDATYIQLYLAGHVDFDKKAFARSDVNGDGKVNISDVTYIQMYRADLIHSFDEI